MFNQNQLYGRRRLLKSALAGSVYASGLSRLLPAYAQTACCDIKGLGNERGPVSYELAIRPEKLDVAAGRALVTAINHTIPGPLIELYEGEEAVLRVTNHLDEDSSVHWHGILLPFEMDGVPGVSFRGIPTGETFEARFKVRQSGTYWYHSHSGFQEQTGVYGPLIIHPANPEPVSYDRDYIIMFSDWTFEDPHRVFSKLKKKSNYYNFNQPTLNDYLKADPSDRNSMFQERKAWAAMRMDATDIADVTGYSYTYLLNGLTAGHNWTGLFQSGERIRLRFINASSMTYFNIRIPNLSMTVIQADGQNVQPVQIDEFQLAVAETLDVIVQPTDDKAYTIFAESMDRSGYVSGTLAPRLGMSAAIPELRKPPRRAMADMGMDHSMSDADGDMQNIEQPDTQMPVMEHQGHQMSDMPSMSHQGHQMQDMPDMNQQDHKMIAESTFRHNEDTHGLGNASIAMLFRNRLNEPGTGLENVNHRVLVYADLKSIKPITDTRQPAKTVEIHLTSNMERYMWSFDGKKYSDSKMPVHFPYGERVRLVLVNDTMMEHPIHLHGMFMELENGQGQHLPRKHTINVKPAERLSLMIAANESGRWAFHCHMLFHMEAGMFRVVEVS